MDRKQIMDKSTTGECRCPVCGYCATDGCESLTTASRSRRWAAVDRLTKLERYVETGGAVNPVRSMEWTGDGYVLRRFVATPTEGE